MVLGIFLSFVVIMLIAMYVEAGRRSRQVNLRSVAAPPSPEPPKAIPATLRAELDQTPQWWFTTFHQLLRSTGAEQVGGEEWELSTFSGPVYMHREVGYPDCPCRDCRRICR